MQANPQHGFTPDLKGTVLSVHGKLVQAVEPGDLITYAKIFIFDQVCRKDVAGLQGSRDIEVIIGICTETCTDENERYQD